MTCNFVKGPDGQVMIYCSRNRRKKLPPCSVCGELSSKLCDFVVDRAHAGNTTCDKPLCDRCAVSVGSDIDHCPDHPPAAGAQGKLAL